MWKKKTTPKQQKENNHHQQQQQLRFDEWFYFVNKQVPVKIFGQP